MSAESAEVLNTFQLIGFTDPTYGRGNAWHDNPVLRQQLGIEDNHYAHAIPVDDVLRRLFNWEAIEAPVFVGVPHNGGTRYVADPDRKAIVRSDDDTVFNVFKSGYQVHSYKKWLLDTVANIIDDDNLAIGTAGLLRRGGKAYVTVELPDTIKTPSGFNVRPHLLACTSHDGTLSTTYKAIATIVVCDNTLAGALGESTAQHKVRHSKHSIGRLQNVRDALGIVHEFTDDLVAEIERLSSQVVTDNEFQAIIEHLIPVDLSVEVRPQVQARVQNKRELIRHIYKTDERVKDWAGTKLGVLQAFNTYQHHFAGTDVSRSERNALNAIIGKAEASDRLVLNTIDQLVSA